MAKKKDIPAFIRGWGMAQTILTELWKRMQRAGLSEGDFHRLSTPEGEPVLDKLVEFMVVQFCKAADIFHVVIGFGFSLKEMIEAGNYDHVNNGIFSLKFVKGDPADRKRQEEVQFELVHFDRDMTTEQVLEELDKMGCRPGDFAGLCAFGAKYPRKQKEFSIVELASVLEDPYGHRCVVYLDWHGWIDSELARHLCLYRINRDWHTGCRFLVVRK